MRGKLVFVVLRARLSQNTLKWSGSLKLVFVFLRARVEPKYVEVVWFGDGEKNKIPTKKGFLASDRTRALERHFLRSGKERIIYLQPSSSTATRHTASMSSSKTIWRDEQRVTRLIELAIAEFNAGRVKNGKLGAPNYESIAAIVSVDVPILDAQKIKTKLDNMRTEFRMFEDLKSRTGFGWDLETKIVKADVKHWSDLLQIEEKYAKFMGQGLDHYEDLCYIFGNNTASGLYRYAPAQDPATSEEEQRLYDAALGRSARSDLLRAASPFTPSEGSSGS
ncbi:hypothetical protein CJ030_MR5G020705 [Morella rubra]|uniref:Myb/SANT-like domain-containing protein n=1 Tax=Morella rubra TaxID=262757 RepID=A0A6A1VKN9_9ROSI|nr:hypothetical protein CJ030_MR5G020705 [Morella rubra]